jgi:hypothetical protein
MVGSQLLPAQDQCLSRHLRTRRPSREAGSCMRRIAAIRNADNDGHGWVINVNTKISNGSGQRNRERRSRATMIEALVRAFLHRRSWGSSAAGSWVANAASCISFIDECLLRSPETGPASDHPRCGRLADFNIILAMRCAALDPEPPRHERVSAIVLRTLPRFRGPASNLC